VFRRPGVLREKRAGLDETGILRDERSNRERVFRRASISRLHREMEQASRPQPGAGRVDVQRDLCVLHERIAGLNTSRPHVLIGAGGIDIEKDSVIGPVFSNAIPAPAKLGTMPEVPVYGSSQSEYRSVVEVSQETRRHSR